MIKIKKFLTDNSARSIRPASTEGRLTIADLIRRTNAERGRADDERTAEILESVYGTADLQDIHGNPVSETARRILEAGAKRRGSTPPSFSDDKHGRFARAVVNAARKTRNEPEI
jgi:hypothetical protein